MLKQKLFRLRQNRLGTSALLLLLFIGLVGGVLVWQLVTFFLEPGGLDWLLVLLLLLTIAIFVVMGLAVYFLDFEQKLFLLRGGIYIMPAVFSSYKLNWNDIERLELRDGHGFRLIEYRLKPGSPSYQARFKQAGKRRFLATEGRNSGFHGAIPVDGFATDLDPNSTEQNTIRANRLFALLHRFWKNADARTELPELPPIKKRYSWYPCKYLTLPLQTHSFFSATPAFGYLKTDL